MLNLGELKKQEVETERFVNRKVKETQEEVQKKIYDNLISSGIDKDIAYSMVYNI